MKVKNLIVGCSSCLVAKPIMRSIKRCRENDHVPYSTEIQKSRKRCETSLVLNTYQQEAIDAVQSSECTKTLLNLATGSGKTLIAAHILRASRFDSIVCVAPLLCSTEQLYQRVKPFLPDHESIVVDSEGSTDQAFLMQRIRNASKWVIFTTFSSLENVVTTMSIPTESTYLLIDEVHNIVNKLKICEFANTFRHSLYLSATVPEELSTHLDFDKAYSYNIRTAIQDGVCVDYEIYLPYIVPEIPTVLQGMNGKLCVRALFLASGLLQQVKRRCIAYMSNIDEAKRFEKVITKVFTNYHATNIVTHVIHAEIPKTQRAHILEQFSASCNTIQVIINVRVLDEAIDVVACDSIFVSNIGDNPQRTVQRLGRALRIDSKNPTKTAAMFIYASKWNTCVDALQLLKQQDVEFHRRLRVLYVEDIKMKDDHSKKTKRQMDLVRFVNVQCLTPNEIWEKFRQAWISHFQKTGNLPSKSSKDLEEKRLVNWQYQMHAAYKRTIEDKKGERLSQERIDILNATEGWVWKKEDPFPMNLKAWISHLQKNGKPPTERSNDLEEKRLGRWTQHIRFCYKNTINNKKGTKLSQECIDILNATEGWAWKTDDSFIKNLDAWIDYFQKNRRRPTESSKDLEEKRLARWQYSLRARYINRINNNKGAKLSQECIDILNATEGWDWKKDDSFSMNLEAWIDYFEKNKKAPSIRSKDLKEKLLGKWHQTMRYRYRKTMNNNKKDKLSQERIDILSATEGWTWTAK